MDQTAPIRPEERFDAARVAAYLRQHLPGWFGSGEITFEQFPGGRANLTYLARCGDAEAVLRRPPLGPVAPGAHDMRREHTVLAVLHAGFPPAPRSLHLCEDESVMGAPFFVMERRRGWVIRDSWPEGLPGDVTFRTAVGAAAVDTLAALHGVDYEGLGLGGLGRPDGFAARQVEGWARRWDRAKDRDLPVMERLAAAYRDDLPEPRRTVLLHNDFKLDNLMVDAAGGVVAVFDWDMATLGDPLFDVGTMLAYWAEPDDPAFGVVGGGVGAVSAAVPRSDVVDRYAAASGADVSGIAFYHSFALYRVAVIVQQIYIRYLRGQTSDERFAALGGLVPLLAEHAAAVLDG